MFARVVNMKLKTDGAKDYTRTLEQEVIPQLRKQNGFRDEINLLSADRREARAISFWENKQFAEEYHRNTYPTILKSLSGYVEGTPEVKTFEVSNSTFHKITVGATA